MICGYLVDLWSNGYMFNLWFTVYMLDLWSSGYMCDLGLVVTCVIYDLGLHI